MARPTLVHPARYDRPAAATPGADAQREFLDDVRQGLQRVPKRIAPKFFYDTEGSRLFEAITETPEYYPTRTEAGLLERARLSILQAAGFPGCVVELGSGSARKTLLLLQRLIASTPQLEYIPIDVSAAAIAESTQHLLAELPGLRVSGMVSDYRHALARLADGPERPKLFLFLGSSLGNYDPPEARTLLQQVRGAMGARDSLLLGLDLVKEASVLNAAYNDAQGVTAAFNLNLLARINRELSGRFDLSQFAHVAFFNPCASRIEMHLESLADQTVTIGALGQRFRFHPGERIHTENSYKYDSASIAGLLDGTGLRLAQQWSDERGWFSECLLLPA